MRETVMSCCVASQMLVIFFGILSKSIVFSSSSTSSTEPPSAAQVNATTICEVRCFKWRISDTTEDVIEFAETRGKPEVREIYNDTSAVRGSSLERCDLVASLSEKAVFGWDKYSVPPPSLLAASSTCSCARQPTRDRYLHQQPPHFCAMHHTAWTLTSDRIPPPKPKRQPAPSKGEHKPTEPPKSEEVRRLEGLRDALQSSSGREKDPKGGCFCQGLSLACSPLVA